MIKFLEKNPLLIICTLVLVMLLPGLNTVQVSIMEARHFISAHEMVADGHWLLTTMNGEPRYEKPPLPTWLSAFSSILFGARSLFALRLPQVLMVMLLGIYTYLFSNKLLNNSVHSFYNGMIAITSFYIIGITIEAPWDIFTHVFMFMGIYYLFRLFENENHRSRFSILSGIFIGFSILSKGPVSIYALLLPFLVAYGITYRYKLKNKVPYIFLVIIIAVLIGCWWYCYVYFQDSQTFSSISKKETGNWADYNVKPFYYYWNFFVQSGLWTIPAFISLLYPYLKKKVSNLKVYKLTLLWTLFVVVFLSFIPEKKARYLMPVLIPLALNIGFYVEYLFRKFKTLINRGETVPVYLNFGLIASVGILLPFVSYIFFKKEIANLLGLYIAFSIISFAIGILIFWKLKKKEIKQVFLLSVLFFVGLLATALPLFSAISIGDSYRPLAHLREDVAKHRIKVYGYNYVAPEMIWQVGDQVPPIKNDSSVIAYPKEKRFGLLANNMKSEDLLVLQKDYSVEKVQTFDLNLKSRKNKGGRLISDYYILTKK